MGPVAAPGRTSSVAGRILFVRAGGGGIGGTEDAFQFLHQGISGDAEVVVHLSEIEEAGSDASAGVMLRESLAPPLGPWLKLVRSGGEVRAAVSANRQEWPRSVAARSPCRPMGCWASRWPGPEELV